MPIFNRCSKCGKRIKIEIPRNPFLRASLEETKIAVCSECDPRSRWVVVYHISGSGRIDEWEYREIELESGIGLELIGPSGNKIYFPPLASKENLKSMLEVLPEYVKESLVDYPLFRDLFRE